MYLCEVALGKSNQLIHSDRYASQRLPPGCTSVHGVGRMTPDPAGFVKLADGTVVPCGKLMMRPDAARYTLAYDELISYSTSEVRLRYLLTSTVKFHFKN
jgi:hypothetical protein